MRCLAHPKPTGIPPPLLTLRRTIGDRNLKLLRLDHEFGRALARHALAASGKASKNFAVPQTDDPLPEKPSAAEFYDLVFVIAGETKRVGRFTLAFGDKCKGACGAFLRVALHEQLAYVVLPAGKIRDPEVVLGEPADILLALPTIRIFKNFFDYDCVRCEAGNEGINVSRVERPCIFRDKILNRDAICNGQRSDS